MNSSGVSSELHEFLNRVIAMPKIPNNLPPTIPVTPPQPGQANMFRMISDLVALMDPVVVRATLDNLLSRQSVPVSTAAPSAFHIYQQWPSLANPFGLHDTSAMNPNNLWPAMCYQDMLRVQQQQSHDSVSPPLALDSPLDLSLTASPHKFFPTSTDLAKMSTGTSSSASSSPSSQPRCGRPPPLSNVFQSFTSTSMAAFGENTIGEDNSSPLVKRRRYSMAQAVTSSSSSSSRTQKGGPHAATEKLPQVCNQCGQSFPCSKQLDSHTYLQHAGYKCTFPGCQAAFTQRSNLSRHCLGHLRRKPILCCVCNKRFTRKDHCVKHVQESHGVRDNYRACIVADIATSKCLETLGLIHRGGTSELSSTDAAVVASSSVPDSAVLDAMDEVDAGSEPSVKYTPPEPQVEDVKEGLHVQETKHESIDVMS